MSFSSIAASVMLMRALPGKFVRFFDLLSVARHFPNDFAVL
jgi:hypothetical protein